MEHQEEVFLRSLRTIFPVLSMQTDVMLIKKIGKEKFQSLALEMAGFVKQGTGNKALNQIEEEALYCQAFKCLSQYLRDALEIPVTLNTLTTHFSLMPHAVDLAYPGYVEAALLYYTVAPKQRVAI